MSKVSGYWESLKVRPKDQRMGQYLMNALWAYDQSAYHAVTGSDGDCFYDDEKIPAFAAKVSVYYRVKEQA